jgi:hypothetical protein
MVASPQNRSLERAHTLGQALMLAGTVVAFILATTLIDGHRGLSSTA